MDVDTNYLESLSKSVSNVSDEGMSRVSALVKEQLSLEKMVEDTEAELKAVKERLRKVSEETLPSVLFEYGMRELKMADGTVISVSPYYGASIPKDRTDEAFVWLRENGFGDLVKNAITTSFGREEDEKANRLANQLADMGYAVSKKVWVEPMTLKAFVKEQIERGEELPQDLLGVFVGERTKIKRK